MAIGLDGRQHNRPGLAASRIESGLLNRRELVQTPLDYPLPDDVSTLLAWMEAADPEHVYGVAERARRAQQVYRAHMLRLEAQDRRQG